MKLFYKNYIQIIFLSVAVGILSGCAAQAPYLKLDASLQKDICNFDGVQYVPLLRLCDAYGINCRWDSYAQIATLERKSNRILLRAGSDRILVNESEKKMQSPVILNAGAIFVPVSFVKSDLWPVVGVRPIEKRPEVASPKKFTINTVVIDPGHGGNDPGAIGRRSHTKEKEMALVLAKKLRGALQQAGLKVVMTRDSDLFISLSKRANIANRSGADLFVSVHINSSRSRSLRGFECYYLSNATDDNARAVEAFENSSLKLDKDADIEHSRLLDKTLWDMTLTENRLESAELAGYICEAVENSLATGNRGVKSARFYVLKYTHMPSILVEAGYISNKFEELKLKDPDFLDRMAENIAQGILKYKREYERTEGFTKSS
jgi:N-acetylmuramoyl-L-alanine amidase